MSQAAPRPMAPLPSSPGQTPEPAGLPRNLRNSRWGWRTRQAEGKPGEAEPSQAPAPPPLRGPSVPTLPTQPPPCHLPVPWGPGPPAAKLAHVMPPSAVSQKEGSTEPPAAGVGGAEPAKLQLRGGLLWVWGSVATFPPLLPAPLTCLPPPPPTPLKGYSPPTHMWLLLRSDWGEGWAGAPPVRTPAGLSLPLPSCLCCARSC